MAASGGIAVPAPFEDDPYRALDDLMAVVEALCPAWPPRVQRISGADMRL